MLWGRCSGPVPSALPCGTLPDVLDRIDLVGGRVALPFDLSEVAHNLRYERYVASPRSSLNGLTARAARSAYYAVRPLLTLPIRKRIQRVRLHGWEHIRFPSWPVDTTLDVQMQRVLAILLRAAGIDRLPFIWFWPEGARACMVMTHDVETSAGLGFCRELMDIDDAFGIKASIEIVPEQRYQAPSWLLETMRARGFEVNVHDLNHDGRLFDSKPEFERRAREINRYARQFGSRGFRSGAMYRNQQWYDAFEFFYDMSVPNVAHLEPQRGGCCTVMPYFVGGILELPLTTIQDYSLFHILGDYSIDLWRRQVSRILEQNGLISLVTHPDYLIARRARSVYQELLAYLSSMGRNENVWTTRPGELDRWWRNRSRMRLVRRGRSWRIDGDDAARARIAYASLDGDRLVYTVDRHQEVQS